MATIISSPDSASLIESPTMVSVYTTDSQGIYNSSSLQHICELYVWDGNKGDQPASPSYTLRKFPTTFSELGQKWSNFDVSPIISSFMTASMMNIYGDNQYNTKWYNVEVYEQAKDSSLNVITGSHDTMSDPRIAIEGYNKWGEKTTLTHASGSRISSYPKRFPFLTTAPDFQEIYRTDVPFFFSTYARWDGDIGSPLEWDETIANYLAVGNNGGFISSTINGVKAQETSSYVVESDIIPPSYLQTMEASGSDYFTIVLRDTFGNTLYPTSSFIQPNFECQKKYTPQRIAFRNRFGAFEQYDFNLVSRNTFQVDTQTYHQNKFIGFGDKYEPSVGETTYISEGYKTLTVNTDYVAEEWNEFFEGMLLSEEIYLVEPPNPGKAGYQPNMFCNLTPLIVTSKTFNMKKEEVDKLIQYSFSFKYAVPYKTKL